LLLCGASHVATDTERELIILIRRTSTEGVESSSAMTLLSTLGYLGYLETKAQPRVFREAWPCSGPAPIQSGAVTFGVARAKGDPTAGWPKRSRSISPKKSISGGRPLASAPLATRSRIRRLFHLDCAEQTWPHRLVNRGYVNLPYPCRAGTGSTTTVPSHGLAG